MGKIFFASLYLEEGFIRNERGSNNFFSELFGCRSTVPKILHPEGIQTLLFLMTIAALSKVLFYLHFIRDVPTRYFTEVWSCYLPNPMGGKGDFLRTIFKNFPPLQKERAPEFIICLKFSPPPEFIFLSPYCDLWSSPKSLYLRCTLQLK